jgi:hypothetical protein
MRREVLKTQYFGVIQDGVKDTDIQIMGPYSTLEAVKKDVEASFDLEEGLIFTILSQEGSATSPLFGQVCQAIAPKENLTFPWK